MTNKGLALGGAGALIVGLFTPIVTLPFLGNVNLFNNGTSVLALCLIALAAISGGLAFKDRTADTLWPGVAAAVILISHFVMLQLLLSQMRANLAKAADGNPFGGLAQTALSAVQLQWGWLVLAVGAGLIIYAGLHERKAADVALTSFEDTTAKAVAAISVALVALAIGWNWVGRTAPQPAAPTSPNRAITAATSAAGSATNAEPAASAETASYIRQRLQLYDLSAKYYDSMLDGRVPGVDFKIKNNGDRTLTKVTVRVVFQDASGKAIAEEEYNPVLVSEYNFGDDNKPLRPNYIWQNEAGKFYVAKSVPSEWSEGKATATITNVEFQK